MKTRKSIKRIAAMIVVLALALTALTAGAFADNTRAPGSAAVMEKADQDVYDAAVVIDNESDSDITAFYMVLASDTSWGSNALGDDTIPSGVKGTLNAHLKYAPDVLFQVRVLTADGGDFYTDPFSLDSLSDPYTVTFVVQGTAAEGHSVRVC